MAAGSSPFGVPAIGDGFNSSKVAFPAIDSSTERALKAHEKAGREVQLFADEAKDPDGTFLLPVSDHGDEINQIVQTALEEVWLGQKDAQTALTAANQQVNALFENG